MYQTLEFIENVAIDNSSFYLGLSIPEKKAINAIKTYGRKDDSPEDMLVLFDATIFGSAKAGFYIASFHFCYCDENGNKGSIDIDMIDNFSYEKAMIMNYLIVNYTDDNGVKKSIKAQFNCYENNFLEPLNEFLNKLLSNLKLDLLQIIEEEEAEEAKKEEAKRIEAKKAEEIDKLRIAEIEKNKKQKAINEVFEPTDDEFLNRTNALFIGLNDVFGNLLQIILALPQFQLNLNLYGFEDEDSTLLFLGEILIYKRQINDIKLEYQKMLTVSEIIQNNQDLIIQRLDIIRGQLESYERAIKIVDNYFFNVFGFESSRLEENEEKARKIIDNFINNGIILTQFEKKHFDEEAEEEYSEYQDKDKSSVLSSFFDKNQDTIIGKLKNAGIILSASTLQNDDNIIKIANIVYNLLPTPIRFVVGVDVVENFLLKNRDWLINKIR